jgi:hypothetical protein
LELEGGFGRGASEVSVGSRATREAGKSADSRVSCSRSAEVSGMSCAGGGASRERNSAARGRGACEGRNVREAGASPGEGTVFGNHVVPLGTGGFLCGRGE